MGFLGVCFDQDEYIHLSHASSEDVFKTYSRRLDQDEYIRIGDPSLSRLQDVFKTCCKNVFKTSWRHVQDVLTSRLEDMFKTSWQVALKTSSRRLGKSSWRRLQNVFKTSWNDVFKTYHQVSIQLVFETYWEDDYLQKDFPGLHFWEIYGRGTTFSRMNSLDIPKLLKQLFKTLYEVTRYYC